MTAEIIQMRRPIGQASSSPQMPQWSGSAPDLRFTVSEWQATFSVWASWGRAYEIDATKNRECGQFATKTEAMLCAQALSRQNGNAPVLDATGPQPPVAA